MKAYFIALPVIIFGLLGGHVYAINPDVPNNKFGIHLAQPAEADIKKAAELVNSSGGTWGYITLVIQENDRDVAKWQNVFNQLRSKRLIPIIRLATKPEEAKWRRPNEADAEAWVKFLNSLQWVTRDRYVILFNEPNHGAEWGGVVDPEGYADIAARFATALEDSNKDFFLMLAGLDAAAPSNPPAYEDEAAYLRQVFEKRPELLDRIEGISSHSYANPGFVGSPYDTGRNTIHTYEWELEYLKALGLTKELPVFITETGWPHSSGGFYSSDVVGAYTEIAYRNVWLDDARVRAVTPFILNYQGEPFQAFSWVAPGESSFYSHYFIVKAIPKVKGEPEQIQKGSIRLRHPSELLVDSTYHFQAVLKNDGQAIWDSEDDYALSLEGLSSDEYFIAPLKNLVPGQETVVDVFIKTDNKPQKVTLQIHLMKGEKTILSGYRQTVTKVPLPKLSFEAHLFPKLKSEASGVELQIFDDEDRVVFKKRGLTLSGATGTIDAIQNIALNIRYRVVILVPYYLPRQAFIRFQRGSNAIVFERLLPFDPDQNGRLGWGDIGKFFQNLTHLKRLIP